VGAFLACSVAGAVASIRWPGVFPILMSGGFLAVYWLSRSGHRRVRFDAGSRTLLVTDSGRAAGVWSAAFSDIRSVTVEQREPRRIANAPPVLAVNGLELLSVKDGAANVSLEAELQSLVGLSPRPSPRDTSNWSGL